MASGIQVRKDLLIDSSDLQLVKQIGEGSYGQVWKGLMGTIDIAVKKLILARATPPILRNIEKEIDTLATLHHAHVLQIYGVCLFTSEFWIVMEYADGGSLYSLLSDESLEIPWDVRWKWIRELAASVAFLHKRGIVHRDIKSPNFLIVKDSIKICDFGMATTSSVSSTATLSSAIKSAGSIGTVRWLAPECTARVPIFDTKTDVYGMGMVIWEVASREIPFKDVQQDAQVVCLVKYEKERPIIPADCPAGIAEVIRKCWHDDPNIRPTAAEAVLEINQVITQLESLSEQEVSVQEKSPESTFPQTLAPASASTIISTPIPPPEPTHPPLSSVLTAPSVTYSKFSIVDMITTFAGSATKKGNTDGTGTEVAFQNPSGICFNPNDNCFYVSDRGNNSIRKITLQGKVSTYATDATLKYCGAITLLYRENSFFVVNDSSHNITKIDSQGTVTTFAGGTKEGSNDGIGTNASFRYPSAITVDQHTGNVYVADSRNFRIRKVTPQGEVSTLVGSISGCVDGSKNSALLGEIWGMCFDPASQSLLVSDSQNGRIRRVMLNGDVSTLCELKDPLSITVAADNLVLVATQKKLYRLVSKGPQAYEAVLLAGTDIRKTIDGNATQGSFSWPSGIAVHEASHSCFISETTGSCIRKVSFGKLESFSEQDRGQENSPETLSPEPLSLIPALTAPQANYGKFSKVAMVTTIAGAVENIGSTGTEATFHNPHGISVNPNDNCIYVSDKGSSSIQKITLQGKVSTYVTDATLAKCGAMALLYRENSLFVVTDNNITKIDSNGAAKIFAGGAIEGSKDAIGPNASFTAPSAITVDQHTGNVFVADSRQFPFRIRKITPKGEVSTLVGSAKNSVLLGRISGICFDPATQSLLVCDSQNEMIRRISLNGEVSTLCKLEQPLGITMAADNVIIVTTQIKLYVLVPKEGSQEYEAVWLAGTDIRQTRNGKANEASFSWPIGIAVHEASQSCFIAEWMGRCIRKVSFVTNM